MLETVARTCHDLPSVNKAVESISSLISTQL